MTAEDFNAWQAHMKWSDAEVARRLGLSRTTVYKYKAEGVPDPSPVPLACAALAFGLPPWRKPEA